MVFFKKVVIAIDFILILSNICILTIILSSKGLRMALKIKQRLQSLLIISKAQQHITKAENKQIPPNS